VRRQTRTAAAAAAVLVACVASAPASAYVMVDGFVPAPEAADEVFPIDGPHDLGRSWANRFGGGRGHEGQDMFAECGTPVVAARAGTVTRSEFHGAAGNYAVVADRDGEAVAYMHLQQPAVVAEGERVEAGDRLGRVGDTGSADGCHLHLELWTAPGYYVGGHAIDPLPWLKKLDAGRALPSPWE
jgi:murein DD-endopeptidase MepM/ murein hydrolase activator NlpD